MAQYRDIQDIQKEVYAYLRFRGKHELAVRIFETDEEGFMEYCVEVFLYRDGEFCNAWTTDIFTEYIPAARKAVLVQETCKEWNVALVQARIPRYHA